MKKLITILFALTIIFASCSKSPQQKCEKAVIENLKNVLNDDKSYESVSFDSLIISKHHLIIPMQERFY